jgi:hypothetical protein
VRDALSLNVIPRATSPHAFSPPAFLYALSLRSVSLHAIPPIMLRSPIIWAPVTLGLDPVTRYGMHLHYNYMPIVFALCTVDNSTSLFLLDRSQHQLFDISSVNAVYSGVGMVAP